MERNVCLFPNVEIFESLEISKNTKKVFETFSHSLKGNILDLSFSGGLKVGRRGQPHPEDIKNLKSFRSPLKFWNVHLCPSKDVHTLPIVSLYLLTDYISLVVARKFFPLFPIFLLVFCRSLWMSNLFFLGRNTACYKSTGYFLFQIFF